MQLRGLWVAPSCVIQLLMCMRVGLVKEEMPPVAA
jgi:hypothetical protein